MNEIKQKIKAIIFDMDGTIIDTQTAWQTATVDVIKHYTGQSTFNAEQKRFFESLSGGGLESSASALKRYFALQASVEEIIKRKTELVDMYVAQELQFITGFEAFHRQLQKFAIPTSIATNASPEFLEIVKQKMNLGSFFGDKLFCSADVGNKAKPDPALFIHAAQQLGVKPEECVVFEDSLVGFKAAQASGMKCIAIKNTLNHSHLDQVNHAIESYLEAEEALKKI